MKTNELRKYGYSRISECVSAKMQNGELQNPSPENLELIRKYYETATSLHYNGVSVILNDDRKKLLNKINFLKRKLESQNFESPASAFLNNKQNLPYYENVVAAIATALSSQAEAQQLAYDDKTCLEVCSASILYALVLNSKNPAALDDLMHEGIRLDRLREKYPEAFERMGDRGADSASILQKYLECRNLSIGDFVTEALDAAEEKELTDLVLEFAMQYLLDKFPGTQQ